MDIIYEKKTDKSLKEALESLKGKLKENGFGVLLEMNYKDKLEEKELSLKDDYVILEVCTPKLVKEALEKNIYTGYLLPCKMVVRTEDNKTCVGMTNPEKLIGLFNDADSKDVSKKIRETLKKLIEDSI